MGMKTRLRGTYKRTVASLKQLSTRSNRQAIFDKYGRRGVEILAEGTPKRTGATAASWTYEVLSENGKTKLVFYNTNVNKGVNIAVILQYGHGTGTGGYVVGRDYINPALQPIFDNIADAAWKEVVG